MSRHYRVSEISNKNVSIFTVEYSDDNVEWFDLLEDPPEWACRLMVDLLEGDKWEVFRTIYEK